MLITEYPIPTSGGGPCGPCDITAGPDGNLWFTERQGNKMGKITTSGQITEYPVPTPVSWSRNGSREMYLALSTYGSRGDVEPMVVVAGPRRTTVNQRQMPNNVSTALRRESTAVLDGE